MKQSFHIKGWLIGLALTGSITICWGQSDSMEVQQDTVLKGKFRLQSFGISFRDGISQYFNGYNYVTLLANARAGLPLFFDWPQYSGEILVPDYTQYEGHIAWVDTVSGFKMRVGLTYFQRFDSMATNSMVMQFDTILGRNASEFTRFGGVTWAGKKQSRKIASFFRLYGGAELEILFSPISEINFLEYAYDVGEDKFLSINEFQVKGKPKFNIFGSALLGLETVFFEHMGLLFEVKSGLGIQLLTNENSFGLAKNAFHVGLNYYFFDYKRKRPSRSILNPVQIEEAPLDSQGLEKTQL